MARGATTRRSWCPTHRPDDNEQKMKALLAMGHIEKAHGKGAVMRPGTTSAPDRGHPDRLDRP